MLFFQFKNLLSILDTSERAVHLTTMPATKQPMKFKIGTHNIIYIAKDDWDNQERCVFSIIVKGEVLIIMRLKY